MFQVNNYDLAFIGKQLKRIADALEVRNQMNTKNELESRNGK